jgi:F-box protein 21
MTLHISRHRRTSNTLHNQRNAAGSCGAPTSGIRIGGASSKTARLNCSPAFSRTLQSDMATTKNPPAGLMSLPDELLEAVVADLGPADTTALGLCCRRTLRITSLPSIWRRHCLETWHSWHPRHDLTQRLVVPPAEVPWRQLYRERAGTDRRMAALFEELLSSQQHRFWRMATIADHGRDVVELLARLREAPDTADDVLARRYHATAILSQIHRAAALDTWMRLRGGGWVPLEEALGAFDQFVLAPTIPDLDAVASELDRVARDIRDVHADIDGMSVRQRAVTIVEHLRARRLVGMTTELDYHALRNNFLTTALREQSSLPLQSAAVYCAIAHRLGIDARPSNYPRHVYVVVGCPDEPNIYLDPWGSRHEVLEDQLRLGLLQQGLPADEHGDHLGPTTALQMTLRTARNIMVSVEEARHQAVRPRHPDIDAAWYSMLWIMVLLGDGNDARASVRRRQFVPYLVKHFQAQFPEDAGLVELLSPLFAGQPEHHVLEEAVRLSREADDTDIIPSHRAAQDECVTYRVGHHFRHRRYGYEGFIVGWDKRCGAGSQWIEQMRVDELPRGREQPFYNVLCVFLSCTLGA